MTLKERSVAKELDNLKAMVRQGRIEEALAALDAMGQALGQVEKQVENASERFGGKEWREATQKGKAIQEQMKFIRDQQQRLRGGVHACERGRELVISNTGGLNPCAKSSKNS